MLFDRKRLGFVSSTNWRRIISARVSRDNDLLVKSSLAELHYRYFYSILLLARVSTHRHTRGELPQPYPVQHQHTMADWAGTASDLTGYREYRAFINNPPNASDPGARWAGMPEFASSSQSARSVSASKVPLPSSNSTRYSRQSSTAARSNPSVSAGVASHAFRSSKFLGYSSNNPNAPWNYKPKPLSPSKIWLPMSSIRRLPTSYIGHGSSRFVDDDFGLKVFRKCEGYRTGQEPVQPYIPPPQWPPEPEHKLDEFTGPRPLKHAVVHHPTWQYQPEPRGARGDPASLFTDISKKRFRRALIAAHRVKLSFRRILGHGGFGLAALFQVEPLKAPRPGHPKQVVVKITMREGGANELLLEMKFHQVRIRHSLLPKVSNVDLSVSIYAAQNITCEELHREICSTTRR